MGGIMKPGPFKKLIDEAKELGIETDAFTPDSDSVEVLKAEIARVAGEKATEAVAAERLAAAAGGMTEDEEFAGFDEAAGEKRGVLIRLVEFIEWVPIKLAEDKPLDGLTLANGFAGFEAGKKEKVVSIESLDTNRRKRVPQTDDPSGPYIEYSAHVFKVVLANEVTTDLLSQVLDTQGGSVEGITPSSRLVLPDQKPNRQQRRHGRSR